MMKGDGKKQINRQTLNMKDRCLIVQNEEQKAKKKPTTNKYL